MVHTSLSLNRPLYCDGSLALPVGFFLPLFIHQHKDVQLQLVCPCRAVPHLGCSPLEEQHQRNQRSKVSIGMVIPGLDPSGYFVTTLTRHLCTTEAQAGFSLTLLFCFQIAECISL